MIEVYDTLEESVAASDTPEESSATTFTETLVELATSSVETRYHVNLLLGAAAMVGVFAASDYFDMVPTSTVVPTSAVSSADYYADAAIDFEGAEVAYRTPAEASASEAVRRLLEAEARTRGIQSQGIEVTRFRDPDGEIDEVVVTQRVRLDADAALRYWDEVANAVEALANRLPAEQAVVIRSGVAVNIEWS